MSDVAIRVENLGKRYRVGSPLAAVHSIEHKTVRENLSNAVSALRTL